MFRRLVRPLWRSAFGAWSEFRFIQSRSLRAAYSQIRLRRRILSTRAIEVRTSGGCEVHVLTSARDWLNLLWALKTFYHYSRKRYPLVVHEDGSLGEQECRKLLAHFPGSRLVRASEAGPAVLAWLNEYPRCRSFRAENNLSQKVFDVIWASRDDKILLLDSDLLFFEHPSALLDAIETQACGSNLYNRDVASAYTVTSEDAKRICGVDLTPRINSGLALLNRDSLRLDWIEEFLGLPGVTSHPWRIEQTLLALCGCRFSARLLPPEYDVRLERGGPFGPVRHYVGAVRHLMYEEGMERLAARRFLRELGRK